jgi:imidazolonepropionase-like amidohydrolase
MLLTSLRPLDRPLTITHVHLVPMDSERVIQDQTVAIDDGRIQAIAPTQQMGDVPPGTLHVDGRGKFLLPGLADMHVHYWDPGQAALFLANGVTLVRNMTGAPLQLAMQRKIARRELPGPHVVTTTPLVDGLDDDGRAVWPRSTVVTDPSQAPDLVRRFSERGYQQLKVYQLLTFDVHRALAAAAADVGMRVTGHCPDGMTFEQAIANGQTCFEHLTGIGSGHFKNGREAPQIRRMGSRATIEQRLAALHLFARELDQEAIRRLAGHMAERQIWNCPTSTVWTHLAQTAEEALRDANLRYMQTQTVDEWLQRVGAGAGPERTRGRAELMALQRLGNEVRFGVVKLLLDEGAPLLLGTDAPIPFVIPGFSLHEELANLVQAGFSPFQALRCGTSEAARFLGEADTWGTIAVGKRADLLLLAANPLEDIGTAAMPEAVFVNGFYLQRDELDALLEERAAIAAAKLEPPALEAPAAGASVVRQGRLQNAYAGQVNGFMTFRCCRLAPGGWLVEERRNGGPGQEATRRLWLAADFTVERIEDRYPTLAGEVRYDVRWTEDRSTYELEFVSIDGVVRQLTLGECRLRPTWGIGLIALPHLVTEVAETTTFQMLGAAFQARGPDDFAVVDMHVRPLAADPGIRAWTVRVGGPAPSERTYHFDASGEFLELNEMFNGVARQVVPVSAP